MREKPLYLYLAVFNGMDRAENALEQMPKRDRNVVSAVVMIKDAAEQVRFKDVGLTPARGAVTGTVIGGVVGLLTGGAGLVAFGALGGYFGHRSAVKKQANQVIPEQLKKIAGSIGPESSAIIAVTKQEPDPTVMQTIEALGGKIFSTELIPQADSDGQKQADQTYETILESLAATTGGEVKRSVPYPRIHIVINPVSGKDEPVVNVLNRVFGKYGIDWTISITKKYGDAAEFARQAAEDGFDLVAGYGGDGTQHEIANALMGTDVMMGVLPGGTGNGFASELGIPTTLQPAVELLCTSYNKRKIDIAQVGDSYFIQRLFTGIEPEEQTSRADKDKYGTFAYLIRDINRLRNIQDIPYKLTIDGQEVEVMGHKCYVVNSARAGTGLSISTQFSVDDGMLDVFMLSRDAKSAGAALERFFNLKTSSAGMYYWRGQEITIETEVDQPVWTDGEYTGRTPVSMKVLPGGLTVAVP